VCYTQKKEVVMGEYIFTILLGAAICVMGVVNMTGNISTLHHYHRKRVSEENKKPMGKPVGLGTLLLGIALIIFSVLMLIFDKTQAAIYSTVGTTTLIIGVIVGIGLNIYAILKYNKGLF
jgi:L-asparagine transporter-like permease